METVHQIANAVEPPDETEDSKNSLLHQELGPPICLPDDYLLFLRVFGAGSFNNHRYKLRVLDITRSPDSRTRTIFDSSLDWEPYTIGGRDYSCYPKMPGLLPWGCDDQGLTFFWLVDRAEPNWRTVTGRGDYLLHAFGMSDLMHECIFGTIPFYADGEFGDNIRFTPDS